MAQITIGLDFGTHQTKICVESAEGPLHTYEFIKFPTPDGSFSYTIPSMIGIKADNTLDYGFLSPAKYTKKIRYFKQALFTNSYNDTVKPLDAMYFSIWYIAYILFDLEEKYGIDATIQMGVPTDSSHLHTTRLKAITLMSSAYILVEDIFQNDKQAFLRTDINMLRLMTKIAGCKNDDDNYYNVLVFPEAYAGLMPLIKKGNISKGMNLLIDIGGGTTDLSFFTIGEGAPIIYDFKSINRGLNYLTHADINSTQIDNNVKIDNDNIRSNKYRQYTVQLKEISNNLLYKLQYHFRPTGLHMKRLHAALKGRPIIYCGGGSCFKKLCDKYLPFEDIMQISDEYWEKRSIKDMQEIKRQKLCPILSTCYGLSIGVATDDINIEPINDIFSRFIEPKKED